MTVIINGGAGITFPDTVQQTNAITMTGGGPSYYAARAWVNFNGKGTVSIRAGTNVSSVTDLGTGNYRVNFITAMPDANYVVTGCCDSDGSLTGALTVEAMTTTSVEVRTTRIASGSATVADVTYAMISVFR